MPESAKKLSPRKLQVLSAVVQAYVHTGEPVGSKGLAEELGVSSATIRNEMAALSQLGYLLQPHTSAGRIPSETGYRVYVDRLMQQPILSLEEQKQLIGLLGLDAYDQQQVLLNATRVLAGMSRFVALSAAPAFEDAVIRGVQFVQTSRHTAMVVMMLTGGVLKNRSFRCDFDLTPAMLQVFFRLCNSHLVGKRLEEITPAFVQSLALQLEELSPLLTPALLAVLAVVQESLQGEIHLSGELNLLSYREFSTQSVRSLLQFLEDGSGLMRLLSVQEQEDTVQVLIGRETNQPELADSAILLARYTVEEMPSGFLAVVGPTRMDYGFLMAQLGFVAKTVGNLLTGLTKEQ